MQQDGDETRFEEASRDCHFRPSCILILFVIAFLLWLALTVLQALFGPLDGFAQISTNAEGGVIASGPYLAELILPILRPVLSKKIVLFSYVGMLVAVPLFSAWVIAKARSYYVNERPLKLTRLTGVVVVSLAVLVIFNLPYLSNDIYLYSIQGQMLSELNSNPYTIKPSERFTGNYLKNIPWTNQNSPYGPLALLGFSAAYSLSGNTVIGFWALKVALSLPWLVLMVYVYSTNLFDRRKAEFWFIWVAFNPLLLIEVCQNGHLEGWIGLLLFLVIKTLLRITLRRVIVAGVLFGFVCSIKLSIVVAGPVLLMWIVSFAHDRTPQWRESISLGVSFVSFVFLALFVSYLPLWSGGGALTGIEQEAGKTLRSIYAVYASLWGMSPQMILASSLAGNVLAGVLGVVACKVRRELTIGILVCLLVQAIFGRTFLQPWYFCPLIMIAPLLGAVSNGPNLKHSVVQKCSTFDNRVLGILLVLSVCTIAGGYAIPVILGGYSPVAQLWSFVGMVVAPFAISSGIEAAQFVRRRRY